jgi:hypothetical protein
MGVLDRVAARVEAMVEPAVVIAQEAMRASAELASSGLRLVDRELHYLEREFRKESERPGAVRGKKR